jgi:hypothetical protein
MNARLTTAETATALIKGCAHHGLTWGEEAAIHLLITQGTWLRRDEFRAHVTAHPIGGGSLAAWVDWTTLADQPDASPASSGELAILRLACHLAGQLPEDADNRWSLADILLSLDATSALLASRAVAMAALGPQAVGRLH